MNDLRLLPKVNWPFVLKMTCCKVAEKRIGIIIKGKERATIPGTTKSIAIIAATNIPVVSPKIQEEIGAIL